MDSKGSEKLESDKPVWQESFCILLRDEFECLKQRNPRFSMRAFAKKLKVSPSAAYAMLQPSMSWRITTKRAEEILSRLSTSTFIKNGLLVKMGLEVSHHRKTLSEDAHEVLTDMLSMALIASIHLPLEERTVSRLAERFGISKATLLETAQRLSHKGLISVNGKEQISGPTEFLESTDGPTSEVVRMHHKISLEQAKVAIEAVPTDQRDFSSVRFVGSRKNLEKLVKAVRELENTASTLTFDQNGVDTVYALSIQLYPLDHRVLNN